jgi:hypothetical protein
MGGRNQPTKEIGLLDEPLPDRVDVVRVSGRISAAEVRDANLKAHSTSIEAVPSGQAEVGMTISIDSPTMVES